MSRVGERWQNERLDELNRRVTDLEGEVSVRQDHQEILRNLAVTEREVTQISVGVAVLTQAVRQQQSQIATLVDLLEPKGSVVINVGAVSEVN